MVARRSRHGAGAARTHRPQGRPRAAGIIRPVPARIIDGKAIAAEIRSEVAARVRAHHDAGGDPPAAHGHPRRRRRRLGHLRAQQSHRFLGSGHRRRNAHAPARYLAARAPRDHRRAERRPQGLRHPRPAAAPAAARRARGHRGGRPREGRRRPPPRQPRAARPGQPRAGAGHAGRHPAAAAAARASTPAASASSSSAAPRSSASRSRCCSASRPRARTRPSRSRTPARATSAP